MFSGSSLEVWSKTDDRSHCHVLPFSHICSGPGLSFSALILLPDHQTLSQILLKCHVVFPPLPESLSTNQKGEGILFKPHNF